MIFKPHKLTFPSFVLTLLDNKQKKQRLGKHLWTDKQDLVLFVGKIVLGLFTILLLAGIIHSNGMIFKDSLISAYLLVINRKYIYDIV